MKKQILTILLGVTTLTAFSQVPSYVPTNGLVGYWPFNGNANDESGNGNNGTVNGATLTTDRNGVDNKAYSFNGTSNKIEVPDANSLDLTNAATISGWFNIVNLNIDQVNNVYTARFVDKTTAGTANGYMVDCGRNVSSSGPYYCSSESTRIRGIMGGCVQQMTPCFSYSNNWKYFVVTFNSGNEKIYVDGNLVTSISCTNNTIPTNTLPLSFAYGNSTSNPSY